MSFDHKPLYFFGVNRFRYTDGPGYIVQPDDIMQVATDVVWHDKYESLHFLTRLIFEKIIGDTDETFIRCLWEFLYWGMLPISGTDEIRRRYAAYLAVCINDEEYKLYRDS